MMRRRSPGRSVLSVGAVVLGVVLFVQQRYTNQPSDDGDPGTTASGTERPRIRDDSRRRCHR